MALDFSVPCHTEHRVYPNRVVEVEVTAHQYTFGEHRIIEGEDYEYGSGCLTGGGLCSPVVDQQVWWRRVRKPEQLVVPTLCVGESR